jgi:hypothetical protein
MQPWRFCAAISSNEGTSANGAYVWSGRASQGCFVDLAVMVLHQCIRPLIEAVASGHHGYQRADDLISG